MLAPIESALDSTRGLSSVRRLSLIAFCCSTVSNSIFFSLSPLPHLIFFRHLCFPKPAFFTQFVYEFDELSMFALLSTRALFHRQCLLIKLSFVVSFFQIPFFQWKHSRPDKTLPPKVLSEQKTQECTATHFEHFNCVSGRFEFDLMSRMNSIFLSVMIIIKTECRILWMCVCLSFGLMLLVTDHVDKKMEKENGEEDDKLPVEFGSFGWTFCAQSAHAKWSLLFFSLLPTLVGDVCHFSVVYRACVCPFSIVSLISSRWRCLFSFVAVELHLPSFPFSHLHFVLMHRIFFLFCTTRGKLSLSTQQPKWLA